VGLNYEMFIVFGKNGRFGSTFITLLKDFSHGVFEFSSAEFDQALNFLILMSKKRKRVCVIWCLGSGNSADVLSQDREYQLIRKLHQSLETANVRCADSGLVYLSTGGKMYGLNAGKAHEESAILPVGIYGEQKRKCELFLKENTFQFFQSSFVFRIANAYSIKASYDAPKGFVENCLWAIQERKKLTFTTSPLSRRQYGSHDDYVRIMLEIIQSMSVKSDHSLFNIAPNFTYNLKEIISIFESHFGETLEVSEYEKLNMAEDTVVLESRIDEYCGLNYKWNTLNENLQTL